MLTADEQERFSRHLLLDALGGAGQERVCAGAVAIDLPDAFAQVAASCARALAAAGVGALALRGAWAKGAARECARLAPGIRIVYLEHEASEPAPGAVARDRDGARERVAGRSGGSVKVYVGHEVARVPRVDSHALALAPEPPTSPAEAAALGALAALEAMKLLARCGQRAPSPLAVFPAAEARAP